MTILSKIKISLETIKEQLSSDDTMVLIESLSEAFIGDPANFFIKISELIKKTKSIPDKIFWKNFCLFLDNKEFDNDFLRRLSERLEESGNKKEYADKIIYSINRIDDSRKARILSNLTQSVVDSEMGFDEYFRLIKLTENMIYSDLILLSEGLKSNKTPDLTDEIYDEFKSNGLITPDENGKERFTPKAVSLVNHGIERGHSPCDVKLERRLDFEFENIDIDFIKEFN